MCCFLYHFQDFYRSWLSIWVTRRVSYKKQELLTLHEHLSSAPFFSFCVALLCVFTFWVPYYDVRYDFRIKQCSVRLYLQLFVVALMSYLRYLCLFTCSGVQHIFCCFSSLVCPMLSISLDCSFLIVPSVSSNVYLKM